MDDSDPNRIEGLNRPSGKRRVLPCGLTVLLVMVLLLAGTFFLIGKERLVRVAKRLFSEEQTASKTDAEDIMRQTEARLREEYEERIESLRREVKQTREDAEKKIQATKKKKAQESVLPPITAHSASTGGDVRKLRSEIQLKTEVKVEDGGLASVERKSDNAYTASYTLSVKVPKASTTLAELETVSPGLGKMLPGLAPMLEDAKVSRWFYKLYENKTNRLKKNATNLSWLLTRHNFYDCETILDLTHKPSGKKVFLMQAEMDVVSDGSDGDRLAKMPDEIVNSTHYQPFTSYGWPKQTKTPNPMVAGWKKRIGNADRELADSSTTAARKKWLRDRKDYLKRGIQDMKYRSFLIAEYDPFIVISYDILSAPAGPFTPRAGDYAVVVHDGVIYPAIVGDGGPSFKVGEASLRMARQINKRASPYSRPVSDLTVTYLVFPNSRGKKQAPDYDYWRDQCAKLLGDIGGLGEGVELFRWEDRLKPQKEPSDPEMDEESSE